MYLTMELEGNVIDKVPVEPYRCKQEGYLDAMRRCLKMKHCDALIATSAQPQFYLQIESSVNEINSLD